MIGLDTNVLVRYLVADDAAQYRTAARLIESGALEGFFISDIVICELVWVLRDAYEASRQDIVGVLSEIFETPTFSFSDRDRLYRSLAKYVSQRGDFADYLIGLHATDAGCDTTLTFDKALKTDVDFRLAM
jgi:predicted nucleic-acid-binding protein